jgi:hypothetical protein
MWIGKNSLPAGGVRHQSGRDPHEFHPSFAWPPARHILFSFFSRSFSRGHTRSKESASAFCGPAGADFGH